MPLHPDEIESDATLVRILLAGRFPEWAELRVEHVETGGTDFAIYRLGEDKSVRLPRRPSAAEQLAKEDRWLPELAPHLPLAVPRPLARGEPEDEFPWPWSVRPWLEGEDASRVPLGDAVRAARDLARFVVALRIRDTEGGPPPGTHNFHRGEPLVRRDASTRAALDSLRGVLDDVDAVRAAWEEALATPAWDREPVWIHGDLGPRNLLVLRGRLHAVLDFGGLGVGDPACDVIAAWSLFPADARAAFRETLDVDDATWARGRGWALTTALVALPYYRSTHPALAREARRTIDRVLGDPDDRART